MKQPEQTAATDGHSVPCGPETNSERQNSGICSATGGILTMREALPEDVNEILAIEEASFTVRWKKEDFLAVLKESFGRIFVAEAKTRAEPFSGRPTETGKAKIPAAFLPLPVIAGFGCVICLPPEGEILNLAVAPAFRRLGVGQAILRQMLSFAAQRGGERVFLEVRESNGPARRLYEKEGFLPCGVRKNYYNHPRENALLLFAEVGKTADDAR